MLRTYFNCNERLEIFLTCFCNILCYVGNDHCWNFANSLRLKFLLCMAWWNCFFLKVFKKFLHSQFFGVIKNKNGRNRLIGSAEEAQLLSVNNAVWTRHENFTRIVELEGDSAVLHKQRDIHTEWHKHEREREREREMEIAERMWACLRAMIAH